MKIIVGARGRVGSGVVNELSKAGENVRAVVRNTNVSFDASVDIRTADLFNVDEVIRTFEGGTTVFLITPEDPASKDIMGDTQRIIANYKEAIKVTGIKKIVGLSCAGAQVESGTGNILMSRMLEQAFEEMDVEQVFLRPSYFYSNWMGYIDVMKAYGVLPTFFPGDLKIEMNSPLDIAALAADILNEPVGTGKRVIELAGPELYSSADVAEVFSRLLNKPIALQIISEEERIPTLLSVGFTDDTAKNLSDMTQIVIDQSAGFENPSAITRLPTALEAYAKEALGQ